MPWTQNAMYAPDDMHPYEDDPPEADPGLPRLTERFLSPHPFACRVFGCRVPVAWIDLAPVVGVGYCDDHRPRRGRWIPIAIYGREWEGWEPWPMSLARYLLTRGDR